MATDRHDALFDDADFGVTSGDLSVETRRERPRSRSDHLRVYLAAEDEAGGVYHTSRLCSRFPVPARTVARADAEAEGHSFCWQCFELEMRALKSR